MSRENNFCKLTPDYRQYYLIREFLITVPINSIRNYTFNINFYMG